jgi:hypothetical protein
MIELKRIRENIFMESTRRKFLHFLLATPLVGLLPQKAPAAQSIKKTLISTFAVAGFQYDNGPKFIGSLRQGETLRLAAEPKNRHDEFAVQIFYRDKKIGYVPRSDNRHISRLLQENVQLACTVAEGHPDLPAWEMLKVEVFLVS